MNIKLWIISILVFVSTFAVAQGTKRYNPRNQTLERAMLLFEHNNYSSAQYEFEKITRSTLFTESQRLDAQYYVGLCALKLDQPENYSIKYLMNFADKNPNHTKAQWAVYEIANHYYTSKKFKEATEYYNKISLADFPKIERERGRFQLGYAYFELSEYDLAEQNFDRVKNQNNEYKYAANYYSGYIKHKNGKYDEALIDFKVAEQNESYSSAVPVMVSNIYYKMERFDELIKYATPLVDSKKNITNKVEIIGLLAEAYFELNDFTNAKKWYEKFTTEKKGVSSSVNYKYGLSAYNLEDYKTASNQFKMVAGVTDSLSQIAAYYLGNTYLKLKDNKYALNAFKQARSTKFDLRVTQNAFFNEGKILFENKSYGEAATILTQLSTEYPDFKDNIEVRNLISESYLLGNDYKNALNYLEKLESGLTKRQKVVYQKVAHQQGLNYYNTSFFEDAIKYFDKSMTARSDQNLYLESVYYRAEANSNLGRWEEALKGYKEIQTIDYNKKNSLYAKSYYGLGYAYFNTKEYRKARVEFDDYLRSGSVSAKSPFYASAVIRVADCYLQEKKFTDARVRYKEVIELKSSQTAYAKYMTGLTFYYENKNADALSYFADVVDKHSTSVYYEKSLFQKGYLSLRENKNEDAVASFTKLIQDKPHSNSMPESYYYLAKSYTNMQNYEKAISVYDYIIKNFCRTSINGETSLAADAIAELELLSSTGKMAPAEYMKRLEFVSKCVPGIDLELKKFELAKNQYFEGQETEALLSLDQFMKEFPDSKFTLDAQYYMGEGSLNLEDYKTAKFYLEKVAAVNPNNFYLDAVYYLAQIAQTQSDQEGIRKYNQILFKNAQTQSDLLDATLNLMKSNYELKNYDQSIELANKILNTDQIKVSASNEATIFKAKSYYQKSDSLTAKPIFVKLVSTSKDSYGAEAQYYLAKIDRDNKKFTKSNEVLFELKAKFSSEKFWVSKCFLLIGDNYESLGEKFQAQATFESIVLNSSFPEVRAEAKEKADRLKSQKAKENKINETPETFEIGN